MHLDGSMIRKQAANSALKNVDITQTFELQTFGAETTFNCSVMYFTVIESNVTI